jgi:murein DD-endopeptidase MepM/ murein hydrolase activator NlpD
MTRMRLPALALLWTGALVAAAADDGVELRGEWRQGSVIFGRAAPGSTASFNGRALRVSPEGRFVIGLDRDEPPQAKLVVARPGVATWRRTFEVRRRQYDIQRIDGLPPATVTPPPEAAARIARDYARIKAARQQESSREDLFGGFIWPAVGPISGVFGSQRILNGTPRQPHYGVDVAMPTGTRVVAPAGGLVTLAAPDMYYTGGTIMIEHGHGLSSAFLHLSQLHVREGQEVKQGDLIGEIGMTGRATGPHLDWRINWLDARVDAQLLAGPMPATGASGPAPAERR